ncbi:glycosyltransferase family 2 protein [Thermodesulfobacteriota bacterium]
MSHNAKTKQYSEKIDILIVNYNSSRLMENCLETIYGNLSDIPAQVFVADNGSVDQPEQVLQRFPQMHLAINKSNLGFSRAANQLINQGQAPYILLLNPDTVLGEEFFKPLLNHMEKHPDISIIGPKILNQCGKVQGSARNFPTILTGLFGRTSILSKLFPNNRFTRGNILTLSNDGKTAMEVDWVSGACMLIRRKAIEDVGPMDERFFMYWEDADLCRRMRQKGWKVVYLPLATVIHYVGKSSASRPIRACLDFHKSSYLLYMKYSKWPFKLLIKPVTLTLLSTRFVGMSLLHYVKLAIARAEELINNFTGGNSNKCDDL